MSNPFAQQPTNPPAGAFAAVPVAPQPGQPPAPGLAVPPQAPTPPRPGQSPQAQQPPEQLRIIPDPATNSLIIYGTNQEFQNIKNILKELDAIPRQVLIEAMVLQVDLSDSESFGVDYEIFRGSRTIFGENFSSKGAFRTLGDLFPAVAGFGASSGLSGIVGGQDLRAMIRVLANDSRVKLVSSPSVMAADNRPARIQVGTEEPVPTGTISQAVGGVAQSTSIQYRNTGRILTIIPQVNSKGLVNLQIKAEVSARGEDVRFGAAEFFPSFNTQDAETTAVVHDGDTLVIGGLIGERRSKGRTGIPYLMDIPVLGRFFGTTTDDNRRTELIMMITPRVIQTRTDSVIVSEEFKSKLSSVRAELDRMALEREKMAPSPTPDQAPPMPVPPAVYPPAPSIAPNQPPAGDRGAGAIAPFAGNVTVPPTGAPRQTVIENPPAVRQPIAATQDFNPPIIELKNHPAAVPIAPTPTPQAPAYALSVVAPNVEMPKVAVAKPAPAMKSTDSVDKAPAGRAWTVQVAAVEELQEAEKLVGQLRNDGYNAYRVTVELDGKTWHRVRLGQLENLKEAMELRKTLVRMRPFKTAFVATR